MSSITVIRPSKDEYSCISTTVATPLPDHVMLGRHHDTPFPKEGHMLLSSHAYRRRLHPRWRRTLVTLAVTLSATAALALDGVATAHASHVCNTWDAEIPEKGGDKTDIGTLPEVVAVTLKPGESVTVVPYPNQIWAGVWFTGENGPEGWPDYPAPWLEAYPLPDEPVYSLIGRLAPAGVGFEWGKWPYTYIGGKTVEFKNDSHHIEDVRELRLGINDNEPGNGSGAFWASLAYRCNH